MSTLNIYFWMESSSNMATIFRRLVNERLYDIFNNSNISITDEILFTTFHVFFDNF